jgi:hypothetical protein
MLKTDKSWIDRAIGRVARLRAQAAYHKLLRRTESASEHQERLLLRRVRDHAGSEFGQSHRFDRIHTYADFRSAVPIRDYEQLRPYIDRMLDGHEQALLGPGHRVLMFAMTSGSTDRPKHIPVTAEFVRDYRRGWNAFGGKALLDHPEAFLRGILQISSTDRTDRTARGIPCGSISGLLARSQSRIVRRFYVAPPEVTEITDAESRYYTIMRFALPRDVGWIVAASPATPLKLAKTAIQHAEGLIRDIRDGTLTPPETVPAALLNQLRLRMTPDANLARRLESCLARRGRLLPRDYWDLAFLANWKGGTLALHLGELPELFGNTPVREIGLLATEGRVSVGVASEGAAGLMDVDACFLEFAEGSTGESGAVRRCHELDVGSEYSVIMTNSAGLFRYRIGDCVRVVGYAGQAPLLEFLHRGARVSSMTGEKITEWQVTRAMEQCTRSLGIEITRFVLAPAWDDPPYYRLYLDNGAAYGNRLAANLQI